MFVGRRNARWGLLLAYLSAMVFAHGAHDHGHPALWATSTAESSGDGPSWSHADQDEATSRTHHDGCAACRFLSESQVFEALHFDASPLLVGAAASFLPLAYSDGSVLRSTCRAPPLA